MFRVAARAVGLKVGEGLHQLRHTCVSVLIAEGANPKEIQEWVGHASIEETMDTYGHWFPNAKHQISSMLDKHALRHSDNPNLKLRTKVTTCESFGCFRLQLYCLQF